MLSSPVKRGEWRVGLDRRITRTISMNSLTFRRIAPKKSAGSTVV